MGCRWKVLSEEPAAGTCLISADRPPDTDTTGITRAARDAEIFVPACIHDAAVAEGVLCLIPRHSSPDEPGRWLAPDRLQPIAALRTLIPVVSLAPRPTLRSSCQPSSSIWHSVNGAVRFRFGPPRSTQKMRVTSYFWRSSPPLTLIPVVSLPWRWGVEMISLSPCVQNTTVIKAQPDSRSAVEGQSPKMLVFAMRPQASRRYLRASG